MYNIFAKGEVQPWALGKTTKQNIGETSSTSPLLESEHYKENIKYGSLNLPSSSKKGSI